MTSNSQAPKLRDPLAESNEGSAGPSTGRAPGSGLSLGLPRSRGGRSTATASTQSTQQQQQQLNISTAAADASVRSTDSDALTSRLSALKCGYLDPKKDTYSEYFVYGQEIARGLRSTNAQPLLNPPINRRPPIINIGTWLRCETLDALVEAFLKSGGVGTKKQIISLGAGSDARYWRIMSNRELEPHLSHYLELDFPQNISQKLHCIDRFPALREHLKGDVQITPSPESSHPTSIASEKYTAKGCDLRQLSDDPQILSSLDPHIPTLILAECVLSYLPPQGSVSVLETVAGYVRPDVTVAGICYEMCIAGEKEGATLGPFAKVMLRNLETRGLSLLGARAYSSSQSHSNRLQRAFAGKPSSSDVSHGAATLHSIWTHLPPSQRDRLSRVEGLDEVEELELLLGCYCISWGVRGDLNDRSARDLQSSFQAVLNGQVAADTTDS